jgi:hypothetical protein
MNPQTQSTIGPLYVREVRSRGGKLVNVTLDQLIARSPLDDQIVAVRSKQQSGWLNPYLFV